MRISDWSSDVCSSDLRCCKPGGDHIGMGKARFRGPGGIGGRDPADDLNREAAVRAGCGHSAVDILGHDKEAPEPGGDLPARAEGLQRGGMSSEEHTTELQSIMRT